MYETCYIRLLHIKIGESKEGVRLHKKIIRNKFMRR